MKNTGIITFTYRNIQFKCENPTNRDIDIIYEQNAIVFPASAICNINVL